MAFDEFNIRVSIKTVDDEQLEPVEPQFQIDIYDEDGEWYAQTVNSEFGPAFKHALHLANPVLAANLFPEYFDWVEKHGIS